MKITAMALFLMIIGALGLSSCGMKGRGLTEKTKNNTIDSTNQQMLFVWTETAEIKKDANLNAEVITEITAGEMVTLTGEVSTNKIKVNLRGVDFEDVWVKIQTASGKEGWIFKGMLTDNESSAIAMNDFLIVPGERVGQIKLGSVPADIEKMYGNKFITKSNIYIEGDAYPGYIVFRNSPFELQCTLDKNGKTEAIYIHQPNAPWFTIEGVKIGMSLDQLVSLNGKDLDFLGFGWDYGGVITSFNKGKLSAYENSIWLYLGEPENLDGMEEFRTDREFSTSNKKLPKNKIKISDIMVKYAVPAI